MDFPTHLVDRSRIQDLLMETVATPSVNVSVGGQGEGMLAAIIRPLLEHCGGEVRTWSVEGYGHDNLTMFLPGRPGSPVLLLEAHMDTVAPTVPDQFTPAVREGLLYGRGSCDTKASLVAMIEATRILAAAGAGSRCSLLLAATVDEEVGSRGAAQLVKDLGATVDLAVVGEPTDLLPVLAHKGVLRLAVTTSGVASHASRPELGSNAITAMARVIGALDDSLPGLLAPRSHPLLSAPTAVISTITGGSGQNVVPDSCRITIDRRMLPGEHPDAVQSEIEGIVASTPAALGVSREVVRTKVTPSFSLDPGHLLFRAMSDSYREVTGVEVAPLGAPFGSDAGWYSAAGIPCIVFGPGSIEVAHTDHEFIALDDVVQTTAILVALGRRLASESPPRESR